MATHFFVIGNEKYLQFIQETDLLDDKRVNNIINMMEQYEDDDVDLKKKSLVLKNLKISQNGCDLLSNLIENNKINISKLEIINCEIENVKILIDGLCENKNIENFFFQNLQFDTLYTNHHFYFNLFHKLLKTNKFLKSFKIQFRIIIL
jgi:hypothetical protein